MSGLPDWVVDAVSPTDDELERVGQPLDPALRSGCADVTAPSGVEVDSLLRRLRAVDAPVRRPARLRPVPVLPAVAALALVALLLWPSPYPPFGVPIELAEGELLELGVSIDLRGPATLVVVERGRVELLAGRLGVEVEPLGDEGELAIASGALTTSVVGTRFEVVRGSERETVSVERGRLRVETPEGTRLLGPGERLSWPEVIEVTSSEPPVERVPAKLPEEPVPAPVAVMAAEPRRPEPARSPEEPAPRVADPAPEILVAELGPEIEPEDVRAFRRILEAREMNTSATATLVMSERFLSKHRDSDLAGEVRIIRLEILAQTASPREALGELDGWLGAHADDPQFLRLLELRADVARDGLRDCRSALPGYRVLAARGRGERRARAQAFRGLCAYSEGLNDEAWEALNEALPNDFLPETLRFEVSEALAALESARTVLPMRKAQ